MAPASVRKRLLFAMFEGGGNLSLILPIVAELAERGHDVRVLASANVRSLRRPMSDRFLPRIRATGARATAVDTPVPHPFDDAHFGPTPAWLARWTPNCPPLVWSRAWAAAVRDEMARETADVVAADFVLLGAIAAAEAAGVPSAALVHNTWRRARPIRRGVPFGLGYLPGRGLIAHLRAAPYSVLGEYRYRRDGLPHLNRARAGLGLPPLHSTFEQFERTTRVLMLTAAAFDTPPHRLPPNVRYVGAPAPHTRDSAWRSPWPPEDPRPLVLVSLSTLPQGQGPVLHRVLAALARLPVRALVTLGPLEREGFAAPTNTVIESFVPHDAVMPLAAAIVTQAGLGTVTRALAHGVPLVCLPIAADQPSNAALVASLDAGIRLKPDASSDQIASAIQRVLREPRFRDAARRLASNLAHDDGASNAADELESIAR